MTDHPRRCGSGSGSEARKTNARLDQTNARLDRLDGGLDRLRVEVHDGFHWLGARIDNVVLGERRREHDDLRERVARIEAHLSLEG